MELISGRRFRFNSQWCRHNKLEILNFALWYLYLLPIWHTLSKFHPVPQEESRCTKWCQIIPMWNPKCCSNMTFRFQRLATGSTQRVMTVIVSEGWFKEQGIVQFVSTLMMQLCFVLMSGLPARDQSVWLRCGQSTVIKNNVKCIWCCWRELLIEMIHSTDHFNLRQWLCLCVWMYVLRWYACWRLMFFGMCMYMQFLWIFHLAMFIKY